MEDTRTSVEAISDLTVTSVSPRSATRPEGNESNPYVVVPNTHKVHDLEHLLPTPTRPRGKTTLRDANSFAALVNSLKNHSTRLYGNYATQSFTAVFNDHTLNDPGWRDHTAIYACPLSPEWTIWKDANGKKMTQEVFAQFIEDNAPDCVAPASADMIEISRSLEAKKKVNFAQGIRLSNGQNEITYEEEITGTAAKGKLSVPEVFSIGIPVLEGGARYEINARLRYRIDGGKLTMWFDLERPHKVLEDAVKGVWDVIQAGTGLEILNGSV